MGKLGKPVTQRQLRVGEMIKQALSMIFLKDEAKLPNVQTKGITVTEVRTHSYFCNSNCISLQIWHLSLISNKNHT